MAPSTISKCKEIADFTVFTANDDDDHTTSNDNDQMNDIIPENTEVTSNWIKPVLNYLLDDVLPDDRPEARRIRFKASRYVVIQGVLFKKSVAGPYLQCLEKHNGAKSYKNSTKGRVEIILVDVACLIEH